ncbi:hypothetical protein KOXY103107_13480 [Komagataeibacter xylinus]
MQQAARHGFHRVAHLACRAFALFRQADEFRAFILMVGGTEHEVAAFQYIKQAGDGWGFDFKHAHEVCLAHGGRQQAKIQDRPPCRFGQAIFAQVVIDLPTPRSTKPGEAATERQFLLVALQIGHRAPPAGTYRY